MTASKKTMPVLILFDVWDEDNKRHPAGTVTDLSIPLAKALIAEMKVERADPLPGED